MRDKRNTLYALYKKAKDIPPDALVLSFLAPADEDVFSLLHAKLLFARKEMEAVREKARRVYVDLVARIAATPCAGKTLRQALEIKGKGNPWWYHKTSEKQAEGDETFNMLLQIFTIDYVAQRQGIDNLVICGAPVEIALVLATKYKIRKVKCFSSWDINVIRAVFSRFKFLFKNLYFWTVIKYKAVIPDIKPDVVFQGFWDWSIQEDKKNGCLHDNYFKAIPDYLKGNEKKCAWFLWLDPYYKPISRGRKMSKILQPALKYPQLIFIQKFLKLSDIFSEAFDFRPLFRYMRYQRLREFRQLFEENSIDFWRIFEARLFYYFSDASLPHYFTMEIAYQRASFFYRPKLVFSFIQFFLRSRAFYQGIKFGSPQTIICDMQHASYGREKTFILMDEDRELKGKPDGKAIVVADYFFVMGDLCREILRENGIPEERIFITGSARYDHIKAGDRQLNNKEEAIKVLLAPTLNLKFEFEMIEAAFLAAKGLNVKLFLRSHPFARMEDFPTFRPYRKSIISSTCSLEEDLNSTDLVLFTYSTVAEEAILRGIPVLQWSPCGFNGSAFRDIKLVPSVYSGAGLRKALESFIADPSLFRPDNTAKETVLSKCFYRADAQAALRIAQKSLEILR